MVGKTVCAPANGGMCAIWDGWNLGRLASGNTRQKGLSLAHFFARRAPVAGLVPLDGPTDGLSTTSAEPGGLSWPLESLGNGAVGIRKRTVENPKSALAARDGDAVISDAHP